MAGDVERASSCGDSCSVIGVTKYDNQPKKTIELVMYDY